MRRRGGEGTRRRKKGKKGKEGKKARRGGRKFLSENHSLLY